MDTLLKSLAHDAEAFRLRKALEEQGFQFAEHKGMDNAQD